MFKAASHRATTPPPVAEDPADDPRPLRRRDARTPPPCSPNSQPNARSNGGAMDTARLLQASENIDSPYSLRGYNSPLSVSPYSSPISLRCRATRLQQVTDNNSTVDVYVDRENLEMGEPLKDSKKYFGDGRYDGFYAENKSRYYYGESPRALSTAPSSPTYCKENLRTYSLREAKDFRRQFVTRELTSDNVRPTSHKQAKSKLEKLLQAIRGKSSHKSQECDTETTTTIEDIYIDSSDPHGTTKSSGTSQQQFSDFILPYESIHYYSTEGPFSDRESCYSEKGSVDLKGDSFQSSMLLNQTADGELLEKVKEIENMLIVMSDEELDLERLQIKTLDVSALLQMTRNIAVDRKKLALELSSQIKSRLTERVSARELQKQAKFELDTRTRRLQHEKSELQSALEKELDRRSADSSVKLEKFQSEEQRLRDRVRELAEQNVSLQREISSLKGNDEACNSKIVNSEIQLNVLTSSLEETRAENCKLHQALAEVQERCGASKEDLDFIRQNYKVKEKETKELQKVAVQLQRRCSEQDKTINGLRQAYFKEIEKKPMEKDETLKRLQIEQLRLTGVEQMLRKEVESSRSELESLKRDKISLLNRLQNSGTDNGFFSVTLDHELQERVNCLQSQGLSLLTDHSKFIRKLVNLIKCNEYEYVEEAKKDINGYLVGEYTLEYQNLRRRVEYFRQSLLSVAAVLDEKSKIEAIERKSQIAESSTGKSEVQSCQDKLELELKAENLLTKLLQEKLCSEELELEQLQSEVASSLRSQDILQTENQRLQDELSCLTHKANDMELQIIRKDEQVNQLHQDIQDCTKELTATRSVLLTVSNERDHMWEELKRSRETVMLLNLEVSSLKKKIEALDEHVLIKEGEISILRDSLDKPFDAICSPRSVKDICLE